VLMKRGPFPGFFFFYFSNGDGDEVLRVHQWFRHILTADSSTPRTWTTIPCLGARSCGMHAPCDASRNPADLGPFEVNRAAVSVNPRNWPGGIDGL
jgi:hypothetical protein